MPRFNEFDCVRVVEPLPYTTCGMTGEVRTVPAGTVWTILEIYAADSDDEAYEVECMLRKPEFDGDEVLHSGTW